MNKKHLIRNGIGLVITAIALLSFSVFLVMAQSELSGYVRNIEGTTGLQNVNVSLYNATTGDFVVSNLTDSSGYYIFANPGSGTYNITFNKPGYLEKEVNNYDFTGGEVLDVNLYEDDYGSYTVKVLDYQNSMPLENATVEISWGVGGSCPGPTCIVGDTDENGSVIKEVPANHTGFPGYIHDFNVTVDGYSENNTVDSSVYEGTNVNLTIYLKGSCRVYGSVEDKYRASGFEKISNAYVELLDKNNQTKLNFSDTHFYNTTSASNGYYEVYYPTTLAGTDSTCKAYVYSNVSDYKEFNEIRASGVDYLLIELDGLSKINGSVYDFYADTPVENANINISNSDNNVVYITSTDSSGLFSIWINGSEAHKLKVSKDGYKSHINSTEYTDNIYYGRINITGKAWVFGYVADFQNENINLENVSININDQGGNVNYFLKTDSGGYFSLNVSSSLTYDLNFSKNGYYPNNSISSKVFSDATPNDLGTVLLKGLTQVDGYVSDCENNLQLTNNKISQVSTNLTGDDGKTYEVFSNSGGYYILWIPSTITLYNITFEHSDYRSETITQSESHDVCIKGEVLLGGHVVDKYAVASKKDIDSALISVFGPDNQKYYEDYTNASGNFTLYIGYLSQYENYTVEINKSGYYGYSNLILKGGVEEKYLDPVELNGKTIVNVTVYDDFDKTPIDNSEVRIFLEEDGYLEHYYDGFTGSDGNFITNVSERSGSEKYKVFISKSGYSAVTLGPYSGDENITTYLYAATAVYVNDTYAKPSFQRVSGADVILYYNFSINATYSINETIGYVNATCNLSSYTGLDVNADCTDCEYAYSETNSTNKGVNNGKAQFRRIYVGNYTMTVNGSDVGCGVYSWNVEINKSLAGTNFTTTNLNVGVTKARVLVVLYNESIGGNTPINNAFVSVLNKGYVNCTTGSNGMCDLDYIPSGDNLTIETNHSDYYTNYTNYTIQPANTSDYLNDFTSIPILMTPYPGNLSVRVKNSTNDYLQGINVTVKNSTATLPQETDSGGYANFTMLTGFYNVTVNGSEDGYEVDQISNYFVKPNQTTILEVTLDQVRLFVHVQAGGENVENANVTLWNLTSGNIAKNATGDDLTEMSDSNGNVTFRRVIPDEYNLTINATSGGYEFFSELINVTPGPNYKSVDLNDLENPKYSNVGSDPAATVNEGEDILLYSLWTDNNELDSAVLHTNMTGTWQAYETQSLSGDQDWANFTVDTATYGGGTAWWFTRVNDTANNINETANQTFYITPVFTIDFEDPTPDNATAQDNKWVFVNASVSKTPEACTLSWSKDGGAFTNYTMGQSVNICSKNMTDLLNANYTYKVYANLSTGEENVSETREVEVFSKINFLVMVKDDEGNFAERNGTDDGVEIRVWNSTYSDSDETNENGNVTFSVWPGTYNITVNGSFQGYGKNETLDFLVNDTENETTLVVNITWLRVNVTNSTGDPQSSIQVTVYKSDNVTNARNATGGNLQESTDTGGFAEFKRVLPCNDCNITVGFGTYKVANSTRFSVSEGQDLTVHIDPPPPPKSGMEFANVIINVTIDGVDSSELDNITVTLSNTTGSYSNKTVDGITIISMPGGYWNVTIDGSAVGFGIAYDYDLGLGKIVANSGMTNTEGYVNLQIAGSVKYYVRVEKFGYDRYDDIENETERIGQQSVYVDLDGQSTLNGTVFDEYFYGVEKEKIDNAIVNFYMATDCGSLSGSNLRYGLVTDANGIYTVNISNKQMEENISQSYCLRVIADGYEENVSGTYYFDPGYTGLNLSMRGDKTISGYVKDIITDAPLNITDVKIYTGGIPSTLAYTETTDNSGYFTSYVSSRAKYLNYSINFTRVSYYDAGETIYTLPSSKTYYMRPGGTTLLAVNVTSDIGESLTDSSEIIWNVSSTEYELETGKPYCISLVNNKISCWVYDQTGYLIANGTFLGYGYNNSYVEDPNQTFEIVLNTTILNITTKSDSSEAIDNVTVTLEGSFYQNVTKNGSALFVKIPTDTYNITFSGNMTEIYFYNNTNKGILVVDESMAGKTNQIEYVLNETRALVTVVNESSDGILNISVTLQNVSVATYENKTNQSGSALFREIKPAGNFSILFNNTEIYDLGYIPVDTSINVTAGEDESTVNSITIVLTDVNLTLDMKNLSGTGIDANVTMYFNNSPAKNAYDQWMNGSLSSGVIGFQNVKPTEDYLNENYTAVVDANQTGYGIRKFAVNVTLDNAKNYIEKNLSAMNLNASVFNESGENVEYNVTLRVLKDGAVQSNAFNNLLETNLTQNENSTQFTHMSVMEDYSVNATSDYYFNQSYEFDVNNESVQPDSVTFSLIARRIYVLVNSSGSDLEDGVNISLVNASTGAPVTGTNGSTIDPKINVTDSTFFEFIPDGDLNVSVNSSLYFEPADYEFSSEDIIISGLRSVGFSLSKREINVFLTNESSETLEEGANVSIINKTDGSVIIGLDSQYLNETNVTYNVTFDYIPDGDFYINVISVLYFSRNVSFDTSQITSGGNNISIGLYERDVDVYLYDLFENQITENLTLEFFNESDEIALNLSGDPLNKTTVSGYAKFYGVPDGDLYINSSNENYTGVNPYDFDGSDYEGENINILHVMKGFGYFNVSVNSTDGLKVENAYVAVYYNDTNLTGSAYTNVQGLAIVEVNTSDYSNLLNVTAYTYYGSPFYNRSGPYTLSEGEIKDLNFELELCGDGAKNGNEECDGTDFGGLSCSNFGYNSGSLVCTSGCVIDSSNCYNEGGGGGPGRRDTGGPAYIPCTEDWTCYDWGECQESGTQTRNCVDLNACGTTAKKPETSRSCTYLLDFDAELETISVNAGECEYMEVRIFNEGTVSLENVVVSGTADCCTISSSSIGKISPQKDRKTEVKVCAKKEEKTGSKDITIRISANKIEREFSVKIDVEKEYPEVIAEKIDELVNIIEKIKQNMSMLDYWMMLNDINRIKELANTGMLDDAETLLQNVTKVIEEEEYGKAMWMDYLIPVVVVIVIVAAGGGIFYRRRKLKARKISAAYRTEIERNINMIKNRVSEIERLELDEEDRGFCERVKSILEKTERAVESGQFREAKKYIEDVILMISMLESRLVSKGLMVATRGFRR